VTPSTTAARDGPAQGRVPHRSVTERTARGKAARATVPRSRHADWEPSAARRAPEDVLLEQTADRGPELVPITHGRMLASPYAFFRGAAALMTGDLADTPHSRLEVQLCGDAHPSNFGGLRGPRPRARVRHRRLRRDRPRTLGVGRQAAAASIAIAGRELGLASAVRRDAREARTHRPDSQGEGAARQRRDRPSRAEQLKRKALAQSQTNR
jgi:Uncharacterized protein conserved in bacteria (DUF2252)